LIFGGKHRIGNPYDPESIVNADTSPEFKTGRDEFYKLCRLMEKGMDEAMGVDLLPPLTPLPNDCAWINSPGAVFDK